MNHFRFLIGGLTLILVTSTPWSDRPQAALSKDAKARTLADIGFHYAQLGETRRAIAILEQALHTSDAINYSCFQGNLFAKVGSGYLLAGEDAQGQQLLARAVTTAQEQEATDCHAGTSPTESLANRARDYAQGGHYDVAIELAVGVEDPISLAKIVGYLNAAGQSKRAIQLLNEAIALTHKIDDRFPQAQLPPAQLLALMGQQLRLDEHPELARTVLEEATTTTTSLTLPQPQEANPHVFYMHTYVALMLTQEFAALGADQQAIAILDPTMDTLQAMDDLIELDQVIHLTEGALQYAALGQQRQAIARLDAVRDAVIPADDMPFWENGMSRIAVTYAELGDVEQAKAIATSIASVNEREHAFHGIALAYAKAGDLDAAVNLAQSIGNRHSAIVAIIRHYLSLDQPDVAGQLVQTWQLEDVEDIYISSEVAIAYLDANQPERALEVIHMAHLDNAEIGQIHQTGSMVKAQQRHEWLLPAIARGFAQNGQFDTALRIANAVVDPGYQVQAFVAIADAYSASQSTKRRIFPRLWANLATWFQGLLGESNREKALTALEQALEITRDTHR